MKKWLIAAGSVVVLLLVIALVVPLFVNANTFKPMLERDLTTALGRKVEIGNISLSMFSGSISVDSFSVADDPAFGTAPFLTAQRLSAGVSLMPLIFSKRLEVNSLTIASPHIRLVRAASGRWNYSNLGESASSAGAQASSAPATNNFSVGKLALTDGSLSISDVGSAKTRTYGDVTIEASNVAYTSHFPFQLSATTPGGGTVKLNGMAGPVNAADASLTPFQATLGVKNFDLAATGFIAPGTGLGGKIGFDGSLNSDGRQATSKGTLSAQGIRLAPDAQPATVPVTIDYATTYDLHRETGTLSAAQVHVGKAMATLSGTYNLAGTAAVLAMKLNGASMPAMELQGVLPALGITLPQQATLTSGTLDTALTFVGPLDKLVIAGNTKLANAKLAGFNLGGKLGALASFAGLHSGGADAEIQTLSSNIHVDAAGTALQNLVAVIASVGTLTGNALISPSGQLNCHMVVKLAGNAVTNAVSRAVGKSKVGGLLGSALGALTGQHSSKSSGVGGITIPLRITGTTARPIFRPDIGSAR